MYSVAVRREFAASHYLVGGDWGAEGDLHAHQYVVELQLRGEKLDQHGFLVDILEIEEHFDELVAHFQHQTLNELSQFAGLNPSVEHFARILCEGFSARLAAQNLSTIAVQVWESPTASASYSREL
jgi:6-pyruvoyltetrahydropterin/6-carboxytetrahydropterin synthase